MSNSLRSHESQHARRPCSSPTPGVYSNSYPLSRWCHTTISSSSFPSPSTFNLSQHQGLLNESLLHIRWPKYWSFSISPSIEYSGLISFRIDWFDLPAVKMVLSKSNSKLVLIIPSTSIWLHYSFVIVIFIRVCILLWFPFISGFFLIFFNWRIIVF